MRRRPIQLAPLITVAASLALVACGNEDTVGRRTGAPVGAECEPLNLTEQCMCDGPDMLMGRQVCSAQGWGACDCLTPEQAEVEMQMALEMMEQAERFAADPPGNRSPNRFDWERTEATGGSCEAGRYEGTFEGLYASPAAFMFPVPVAAVPGTPGLIFNLEKAGAGEVFNVTGVKLVGLAKATCPFSADIVGTLDCQTRKFEAMIINGEYDVFGTKYQFEGPITADYDKITHTMVNGVWEVTEPNAPGAGGMGTWTVTWVP